MGLTVEDKEHAEGFSVCLCGLRDLRGELESGSLFADENQNTGGNRQDVQQEDGWTQIQAEP
jgi:hypothetical protein